MRLGGTNKVAKYLGGARQAARCPISRAAQALLRARQRRRFSYRLRSLARRRRNR